MKMKGIILAGGKGTRLWPFTIYTNKHLVDVGRVPMIEYPLHTLKLIGAESVSIVTGGENSEATVEYFKLHGDIPFVSFHYQATPNGICGALKLTEPFVRDKKIAVVLGDNIFEDDFSKAARKFEESDLGAMLFLKEVNDPERFGVAEIRNERIISIEEKPKIPKSNLAVTGLYFYDLTVFDKIRILKPSPRGELEVTDLNNLYIREKRCGYEILDGFWSDAGTHESRERAIKHVINSGLDELLFNSLLELKEE